LDIEHWGVLLDIGYSSIMLDPARRDGTLDIEFWLRLCRAKFFMVKQTILILSIPVKPFNFRIRTNSLSEYEPILKNFAIYFKI